jgi:hypothetical protein
MRALLSLDVDPGDPDLTRIIVAVSDCFPAGVLEPLTNTTTRVRKITVKQFDAVAGRLDTVAAQFAGRRFYVFSLHSDNDPILVRPRPASAAVPSVAVVDDGGPG